MPFRQSFACVLFVASSVLAPRTLWSWVVPWTTTPETTCIFGALLGAFRLLETGRLRDAFLTGFATALIGAFRPVDGLLTGLVIGIFVGPTLLPQWRRFPAILASALVGALVPVALFGGAYLATWGFRESTYMALSARIGFELHLLPLRWVTLVIDPRPLFADGRGLAEVFPWILPGFMGMAATLATVRGPAALPHRLTIALLIGDVISFLIYRDLHTTGLWVHGNYHYFKWTLSIFAVYAFRLFPLALDRTGRRSYAAVAALSVIPVLFCWRASISPGDLLPHRRDDRSVTVPTGLYPINAVVVVPVGKRGAPDIVSGSAMTASGISLRYGLDFVIYGGPDELRIVPLRLLPSELTVFQFSKDTEVNWNLPPFMARQTIQWGFPFWHLRKPKTRS